MCPDVKGLVVPLEQGYKAVCKFEVVYAPALDQVFVVPRVFVGYFLVFETTDESFWAEFFFRRRGSLIRCV